MADKKNKKKINFADMSISQKIKTTILYASGGAAIASFVAALIALTILWLRTSSVFKELQEFGVTIDKEYNSVQATYIITIVVALLLIGGAAAFAWWKENNILRSSIYTPLMKFMFEVEKLNVNLEEFGVSMDMETDDEVKKLNSVYFAMVEQLKTHADDVMKLSGLTEKFENSANFDALTGVYNRRRFTELVTTHAVVAAKKNEPTFVFMLDLDKFKSVNDTYGHAGGDEVLKIIAARIKNTVRPYDLFGRYGGEEFIMFLSANDATSALGFAERVRAVVEEQPVHFEGIDIPITVSIGVGQAGPDVKFDQAVKNADEALYAAKENGRNRVELFGK